MLNKLKKITITVTKGDIKRGVPSEGNFCPIAYAMQRKFSLKSADIEVADAEIWVRLSRYMLSYIMPLTAQKFIKAFDGGKPVKPFSFVAKLN